MKILKIVLAVVLTLLMLYIARNNSRGRPEYYNYEQNGYRFEYNTVPKGIEFTETTIPLTIKGRFDENITPVFRHFPQTAEIESLDLYNSIEMVACDSATECYQTTVRAGEKNERIYYYFEVVDSTGATLATFTKPDGSAFDFRSIGSVPPAITLIHIVLIFATVFFISLGAISSFSLLGGSGNVKPLAKYSLMAAVCAFLGGYPFGIPMNWFAFGSLWEGVPFGADATDNKTQLLFIYLLFMTLATFGSLRGKPARDLFSPRTMGWFGLGSFAVMLFIYLIPHSIQFSPTLTYAFCYSWIGVVVLIYIAGRLRPART